MKKRISMILAFAMCLSLAACESKPDNAETSASTAQAAASAKNALTIAVEKDIGDINVHLYAGSMVAQGMVFEGLVENTADGVKPCLAENWTISDDGTVYTFHLRKDIKFTDGEAFNAQAVKANIDAVQANKERHKWIVLSNKIKSCDVVDDYTVNLILTDPYYPTLTELGLTRPYRMMSPASFKDGGTAAGVSYIAGTGAYKLGDHVVDQYAVFNANEDYWGGAPKIKTVTLKVMPSGQTTLLAFKNGEINFLFGTYSSAMIDPDALLSLEKDSKYQVKYSDPCSTRFLITNSRSDRLISDKNIKQAVWYAIDRDEMCKSVFSGLETPAQTVFDKTAPYCNVELVSREFSLKTAKSLIEQSGWTLDSGSGYYKKNGQTLTLEFVYNSSVAMNKTLGEYIQGSLKKAGIEVTLTPVDSTTVQQVRSAGSYDLYLDSSWGRPYDPQSSLTALFAQGSYLNAVSQLACYGDLDKWVNAALVSTDAKQRQDDYTNVLKTLQEECCFIPLSYSRISIVADADLKNLAFSQTQYEVPFKDFSY